MPPARATYPRAGVTGDPDPDELAARQEEAEALAERFQALADANRLKALHLLYIRGEMCACEIQSVLGVSASNLSFHLQVLRHAGFVKQRKQGKWILYRLAPAQPNLLLAAFAGLFGGDAPLDLPEGAAGVLLSCACGPDGPARDGG